MYIRIAFSIELRLRVSRSLRSLANDLKWNLALRLLFNIQTSDCGATTVAKISLKWNRALWLLFNIQSSDYRAF